jgi:hypothetical protein
LFLRSLADVFYTAALAAVTMPAHDSGVTGR